MARAEYRPDLAMKRKKRPNLKRYKKLQDFLRNDLFNQNKKFIDTENVLISKERMTIVNLFSGAGGLTLGFKMAGYIPIFSVEIDPDAAATYRKNFPESFHCEGDIEDIQDDEALNAIQGQGVHVLCAGFPCQGFSVAGNRDPEDTRNQLFHQFVRFARIFKPWFVVGENVPGVITMEKGKFYRMIIEEFAEAGYPNMTVEILESAAFKVPQLRPRAIFIGNRFGLRNPYPIPILDEKNYLTIEDVIDDLKQHPRDASINHEWTKHSKKMEKRLAKVPPGGSLYEKYFDAWKRQYRGVPSMTIKENHGGVHIHYELNRTISAREMARLQSFPDEFIFSGRMKRVMFQVGNAVPPLLAKHIGLALRPSIDELIRSREI